MVQRQRDGQEISRLNDRTCTWGMIQTKNSSNKPRLSPVQFALMMKNWTADQQVKRSILHLGMTHQTFISLSQIVPSSVYLWSEELWPKTPFMSCIPIGKQLFSALWGLGEGVIRSSVVIPRGTVGQQVERLILCQGHDA